MHTRFSSQLALLDLSSLSISEAPELLSGPLPADDAVDQTLAGIWSDLFALFPDTALERDAEEIAWAFVNLFHRAAAKRSAELDRATDQVRLLVACADGSEVHSSELETQIARAQSAEAAMLGLEAMREVSALLYMRETGSCWRPSSGSRLNHSSALTSAVVDGRDFLKARAESRRRAAMPNGTPVIFAGGRQSFAETDDAKTFATNIWDTLDKVRNRVADMVLVHGGDSKGADRLASSWAAQRKVPQVAFVLDRRLGNRAGFRRNEQMLSLKPRYVIAFPGNGVLERLVIQAKERGIAVVDRRVPLGVNPKLAARVASADGQTASARPG